MTETGAGAAVTAAASRDRASPHDGAPAAAPTGRAATLLLLVLLGTLTAIGPLSIDMYLPAFPEIARELDASASQVQLSLTTLLIGMALGQLVTGPLSDRWGRRRPVIVGMVAYALLSMLCAFSPSTEALAAIRLLQGFAGGMGVVVARAVVGDLYSGVAAARYFSRLTLVFGLAPILAPSLGSFVLSFTNWRGIFLALAAIAVMITIGVIWRLPETLPVERRSPGGIADVLRTGRVLFTDRVFIGYALAQGLAFAGLFAYISGSSFVFQDVFGISSTGYGLIFGANAIGLVILGQLNSRLLNRYSPRQLLVTTIGFGVAVTVGLLVAALYGSLVGVVVTLFLYLSSVGMIMPNGTALALDQHRERAGTAAAVLGGVQTVVGAISAPLVGLGGEHSATPMAAVILTCAASSLAAVLLLTRRPPHPRRSRANTSD